MILIDGKKIRNRILAKIKREVISLPFTPIFCDVLVGDDPSSVQYVHMKAETAGSVGIEFLNASFSASIKAEDLIKEIKILNHVENMCGIIIQLPLPETIDRRVILDAVDPNLDADCLGRIASEKFYKGVASLGFPTALACVELLHSLKLDLKNKRIVVLGQGCLVGRPVAALLGFGGLHPDIVINQTENKKEIIKQADIIISGIGKGRYVTGDMIKKGAILIDAGASESEGGIVGDVDLESVKDIAEYVSPVPGGVGPVTVAMLLNNVLEVAKRKNNER